MERGLSSQLEVARVIQFLNDRENKEGGFGLIPDLDPDIEDTYFAIRTLQLLHHEADQSKTGNYLKGIGFIFI